MTRYVKYIKGGDILIAPSLKYKHQYVLKCDICEEYYGEFDLFLSHYLSHYEIESDDEDDNLSESEVMVEQQVADYESETGIEDAANEDLTTITEHMYASEEEVTISSIKEEIDVEGTELHDSDTKSTYNDNDSEHESLERKEPDVNSKNIRLINKSHDEETSCTDFVKNFIKSKQNVMALIAAYKKYPYLWNFHQPVPNRKRRKRCIAWEEIATELRKTRNIQILTNQVAAVIICIRQKYREMKVNAKNDCMPLWMFEGLSFLEAFVGTEPIAILDDHQDLSPQQIIQMLDILKRCPHLWDSNTMEYYCTNKRNEAITQMKDIITEELDLELDECTLKRYLQDLEEYFVLQKRHHTSYVKGPRKKSKYYQHMIFLSDHLGSFKCSHCQQWSFSPLNFKVHKSQHDGTIPLLCSLCNKDFKSVENYIFHIRRHMDDLNEECKECGKMFLKVAELKSHMRSHTGDKPYVCDICGESFRYRTSFSLHKKRHNKKYVTFCPYCSKGFYTKGTLDVHIASHKEERSFACSTCGKAFKAKKTLQNHEFTHEEGRNHECDLCGKLFKNKINLAHHKRTHGSNKKISNAK